MKYNKISDFYIQQPTNDYIQGFLKIYKFFGKYSTSNYEFLVERLKKQKLFYDTTVSQREVIKKRKMRLSQIKSGSDRGTFLSSDGLSDHSDNGDDPKLVKIRQDKHYDIFLNSDLANDRLEKIEPKEEFPLDIEVFKKQDQIERAHMLSQKIFTKLKVTQDHKVKSKNISKFINLEIKTSHTHRDGSKTARVSSRNTSKYKSEINQFYS